MASSVASSTSALSLLTTQPSRQIFGRSPSCPNFSPSAAVSNLAKPSHSPPSRSPFRSPPSRQNFRAILHPRVLPSILHPRVLEERREALTSAATPTFPASRASRRLAFSKIRAKQQPSEESVMEEGKIDSSEIKDKNDHVDQDSSTSSVNEVKLPEIGMTFSSEEEVRIFYNSYAQNIGFGICKLGGRNGDDGKQKYFSIGCAKNGRKVSQAKNILYPRPSTKANCKAKINVAIRNDQNFVITSIVHTQSELLWYVWLQIRKQINQEDMERIRYISLFVEYVHTHDMKTNGTKLHYRRVLMDDERGKTVPNWRPRRLGGRLGTTRTGSEEFTQKHSVRTAFGGREMVAHFITPFMFDSLDTLHSALNGLLPREIRSAYKLNPVVMREAVAYFVGKHDFSSFANAAHNDWLGNPVKEIFCFDIVETAEVLVKAQQDIGDTLGELGLTFVRGEVEQANDVRYPERERRSCSSREKRKQNTIKKLTREEEEVAAEEVTQETSLLVRECEGGELGCCFAPIFEKASPRLARLARKAESPQKLGLRASLREREGGEWKGERKGGEWHETFDARVENERENARVENGRASRGWRLRPKG
ncbi:hypothetical protein ZIOFF_062978 [Zingiber officinale]|uniref:FAR1 domain-containing protein n=1 Tax=Zingiber officinale TaxID=94328 RepID=A0A8J5F139_ZINOF|nr:hypothetical protein ZIOFF_062978 [Zingiber officinale]